MISGRRAKIFDSFGFGGTLRLNLPSTKLPMSYLVDSETLSLISGIRNAILKRNATERGGTDNNLHPDDCYKRILNHQIASIELGGGPAFNDFMDYLQQVSSDGHKASISELQG